LEAFRQLYDFNAYSDKNDQLSQSNFDGFPSCPNGDLPSALLLPNSVQVPRPGRRFVNLSTRRLIDVEPQFAHCSIEK
jgi:hypothetical protein